MKRIKISLAALAIVFAVASAFTPKFGGAGFFSWDGTAYTNRGTTDPGAATHCLVISSTLCYEERNEAGAVIRTELNGPYTP